MPPTILFTHQKPKATTRMSSRHRPLHACGVSILAIADNIFGKTQDINGPLGSTFRKMAKIAKFATPLIYALQYQLLAILSFIDDQILAIEKITEKLFPPSRHVFDKVDEIVLMILFLPEKFNGLVNKFPTIIHQVPFLEWALTLVISRLNSLVSTLNHWGQENSRVNEKTIGVDRNSNESSSERYLPINSSNDVNSENLENFPPITSEVEHKAAHDVAVSSHIKGSYKEALERGKEENPREKMENECESEKEMDEGECEGREKIEAYDTIMKYQVGGSEKIKDDPLLELFESAWLMKPGRY
ncbi:uncharacterized protein LOC113855840 [Abrus precatorius]|uniref:Uncharacterized protein LOC113855840 n=1 Tax=Abrus precatorius TaxID=3816 RepID=A0A8B8KHH6_ABRPR|nr:uncharacterized protein LOC113855840 [Abrus precatorius]